MKEISVYKSGADEIIIELPGVTMEESESYEKVVESLGTMRFAIQAKSQPGIDVTAEEQRLRDHLKELEDSGEGWTRKSVDLAQFDVKGAGEVIYRWFPWSQKAIEEPESSVDPSFPFMMVELNPDEVFTGEDIARTFPDVRTTAASRPWGSRSRGTARPRSVTSPAAT